MQLHHISLDIQGYDVKEIDRFKEILAALLSCGALSGVKNGRTIIHFDAEGTFQSIELDYWPYRRKKGLTSAV